MDRHMTEPDSHPTDLMPIHSTEAPVPSFDHRLVDTFLSGRKESTLKAYQQDMKDFSSFLSVDDANTAARILLSAGAAGANSLVDDYKRHLIEKGQQPASINRKLATLRSLTKLARLRGVCDFTIEVENLKVRKYRDTKGPQRNGYNRLRDEIGKRTDGKGIRDLAILHLLHDLALRRNEVIQLDSEDIDLEAGTIEIIGKGMTQKVKLSLPEPTQVALSAWLEIRSEMDLETEAVFINLHRSEKIRGTRITGPSVYRIIRDLGAKTNQKVRPHAIRHTAITEAVAHAQAAGMDVTKVLQFSRHADLKTLQIYIDQHENAQGKIADLVAAGQD